MLCNIKSRLLCVVNEMRGDVCRFTAGRHSHVQTSCGDVKNNLRDERHLFTCSPPSISIFSSLSVSVPPPLPHLHPSPTVSSPCLSIFSPSLPPALPRSDESRIAAINSRSVGEVTASDDLPCRHIVHPWQEPAAL